MKIAVLGANGFVGSSLARYLSVEHEVTPVTRRHLDLLNAVQVHNFLSQEKFDVVINAAATMAVSDQLADTRNNLGLFMNFYNNANLFGKFINLGTGAEFDRAVDINSADESLIFERLPSDSYGFGQNIKSRLCADSEHFYTLRIFNCFGLGEIPTRLFPKFISKQSETEFEIQNNRYFDYFSIQDLCVVVDSFIKNNYTIKDVNCVYLEKYLISQVLDKFCELNGFQNNIIITSHSKNNYTGNGARLASLDIPLNGLEQGLLKYVSR